MRKEGKRASLWETLGAWLHVWTPPREIEVPPVPWRGLALIGLPSLAALAVAAWLVLDDASEADRERRLADERARQERAVERKRRIDAQQSPRRTSVPSAPRPRLVAALEAAVLEDARSRRLRRPARRVHCSPYPRSETRRALERDPALRRGRYECLAITNDVPGPSPGTIGYPFRAAIEYRTGSLVWCRVSLVPGELALPDPKTVARLPRECR